jgi:putative hemolysin
MEPPSVFLTRDIFFFLGSLGLCALFSFLETSVAALRLFKLKEMAQASGKYKKLFETLEHSPNSVLISILIAYNIFAVTSTLFSSYITEAISKMLHLSDQVGFLLGVIVSTTSILLVDLVPKSFATRHGDSLFSSTLWMTNIVYHVFKPFVAVINKITEKITRLVNHDSESAQSDWVTSEKEIEFLIEYINQKGLMEKHKTSMLKSIFELGNTTIKEIMIPDTQIISISITSSQQEALDLFSKYQYTRLPVYEGNPDNIVGMVLQKDFFLVLSRKENREIKDIVRPIIFMPESAKLLRALREFREQRLHMAMVINEYGGVSGLVTLEDIIEEIVGEISDEYEAVAEKIIPLKPRGWLVDASIELKELTDLLGISFQTAGALTLGGFLIEQLEHVPKKGEQVAYKNFHFQVQQASAKRVYQILIFEDKIPENLELE